MSLRLALKIDVDTDRGTRVGVPNLVADLRAAGVPATFLFSLGPDNTGRAITRVFRPGFLKKVSRTSVISHYGVRTLLNGTLLPAPHIARRHGPLLRSVAEAGFEVGIHCHDHYRWQDYVHRMGAAAVEGEFTAARAEFRATFGREATGAGAPGWQANAISREVYDRAALAYGSDTRGTAPFFPHIGGRTFRTLEIPTTLPTLDELVGRPDFPDAAIVPHLVSLVRPGQLNVFTLHAELEGMGFRPLFRSFLEALRQRQVGFVTLEQIARECLAAPASVPVCEIVQGPVDGRSGELARQGSALAAAGGTSGGIG